MLSLHKEGYSGTVIAGLLGVKPKTLYVYLHRHGVHNVRNGKRVFIAQDTLRAIRALYAAGVSIQAIAEKFDLPWVVVQRRLQESGIQRRPAGFRRGKEHFAWKGGRHLAEDGYVRVWLPADHPLVAMAQKHGSNGGYCLEHRLVLAQHLGRLLLASETVHHIDGNRQNNDISNLQLRQGKHGKGAAFRCADCGSHNVSPVVLTEQAN